MQVEMTTCTFAAFNHQLKIFASRNALEWPIEQEVRTFSAILSVEEGLDCFTGEAIVLHGYVDSHICRALEQRVAIYSGIQTDEYNLETHEISEDTSMYDMVACPLFIKHVSDIRSFGPDITSSHAW